MRGEGMLRMVGSRKWGWGGGMRYRGKVGYGVVVMMLRVLVMGMWMVGVDVLGSWNVVVVGDVRWWWEVEGGRMGGG